ncbi:hypothetical protein L7F22_042738 [Adiantum nelumboides]|nr:hypothetical protein [Adiantum nelumboides]
MISKEIGDLFVLVGDTHKFEAHYIESLVGSDQKVIYNRSPINFLEKLSCPVILFQGLEDKVVPASQARLIYDSVKSKKVPVALIEYEGEQHGFRKAENIKYTLEQEMVFFARILDNFTVADEIAPVHVDNLDDWQNFTDLHQHCLSQGTNCLFDSVQFRLC